MGMEELMKQWIEIEEYLKSELEKLLLVLRNSNNIKLIHDRLNEYHNMVLIEEDELNLEKISDRKLKGSLSYLEQELDVKNFDEFLLFQNQDCTINPKLRLYSQLKKEKIKRAREENGTDIFEITEFYLAIFEQRLLESYEKVFTTQVPKVDISYIRILYNIMYSFVGYEEISSYKIHLKDWILDIENFKSIEKSQLSSLFYDYLRVLDKSNTEFLYDPFTMNAVSIHFYTLVNLLLEYFTLEKIFDKIDETLKEEEKKEFIRCIFLNSEIPYLKVLERMR